MNLEAYIRDELQKFGKHLYKLITNAGYKTKKEFGIIYNNGNEHSGIYSFFKGKNIKFDSLLRLSSVLNISLIELLNKKKCTTEKFEINNVDILLDNFSYNIKDLRIVNKSTQGDLENINNKPRENISRYENGKSLPELTTILIFAYTFNVPPGDLFKPPKKVNN